MTADLLILGGALAVLAVLLAGAWQLVQASATNRDLRRRTELEKVEAQAGTLRYRADRALRRTRVGAWLDRQVATAGVDLWPLDLALLSLGAVVFGFLLIDSVAPWWIGLLGGYGGWYGVEQYLIHRRNQRREAFTSQLPELARTLSNATSAGRSLSSAIGLASRELDEPASTELRRVAEQLRIGQSVDGALQSLQERLPSRELAVLVSTLIIQQRSGGDVVSALRDMADTLDARKDLRREVKTLMAEAVSTGYVTGALGILLLLFMDRMQPGMIDGMAGTWPGRVALLIAAGLYAVAFIAIRRTSNIEV